MFKAMLLIISIILPPLFLGYVHWDITYITTIGEWSEFNRAMYSLFVLCFYAVSVLFIYKKEIMKHV